MNEIVTYAQHDHVAVLTWDDGSVNSLGLEAIAGLAQGFARAAQEADAVVLTSSGRSFCAGFDLKLLNAGGGAARGLVTGGFDLLLRLYEHPQPVVVACNGHALAAGAVILMCADERLAADKDAKIGLNEVRIGITLPVFIQELARDRLSRRRFNEATLLSTIYHPADAVEVGFVDRVVPEDVLLDQAIAAAAQLALIPSASFAATKRSIRGPLVAEVRATLEEDLNRVLGTGPT